MGSLNSKVEVSVPSTSPTCFPTSQEDEDLSETIAKIGECHLQALQIASWITSAVCPMYAGTFAFSAASFLLTFIIHRLSSKHGPTTSSPNSEFAGPTRRSSYNGSNNSLESALIDSKVSSAIAKKSVCELRAKIHVIRNRLDRLKQAGEICDEERRLEVVPAIQACEEVLQLFYDSEHVLRMNPLASVHILIPFSGVFLAVAEISTALIPSYNEELKKEMSLMTNVLHLYKDGCIKSRLKAIFMKIQHPGSMLDAVSGTLAMYNYRLEDSFTSFKSFDEDDSEAQPPKKYSDPVEAMNVYKGEIESKFTTMFESTLKTLSKYKGFHVDNNNNNVNGHDAKATAPHPNNGNHGGDDDDDDDEYEDVDLGSDDSDTGTVIKVNNK